MGQQTDKVHTALTHTRSGGFLHSPEDTMSFVAGVGKVQSFSNIGQLVVGVSVRSRTMGNTHKAEPICAWVPLDVLTLGARGPETSDYMLRTLRALVE